jgi:hypothetical protein
VPPARDQPRRELTANGGQPVTEAVAKLSPWLSSREAVARVARHLDCTLEVADRRIDDVGRGGRIQARGVVAGQLVLVLPADWNGRVDLAGTTMKPPEGAEITNLELCYIDLVAAGLLPAPAEKAWWSAAEAIAYLIKGVSLRWEAWQRAGASPAEVEQAEIDLGEEICAGVPAQGRPGSFAQKRPIPADDFHPDRIEKKALPVPGARPPKVVVDCGGCVTTSPRQRSADYQGPRWEAVEVDAAALRQARPRLLTTQAEPTASPPPPTSPRKNVSKAELRNCILTIKSERPDDPPDEEELRTEVEKRLVATVARDRIRQARNDIAPEWKLLPGRPRKSTQ